IQKIAFLSRKKNSINAYNILKDLSSAVAPLMKESNLKITLLTEFYPNNKSLLGLNYNSGQKICLRLRSPFDENTFLHFTEILSTLLHELSHNFHGPHDNKFYNFLSHLNERLYQIQKLGSY
ncbi:metalloendopeptidase WSS1, partial [Ascoidea rubescens DSM 1968]